IASFRKEREAECLLCRDCSLEHQQRLIVQHRMLMWFDMQLRDRDQQPRLYILSQLSGPED
ncbi:hypothetical protein KUCAC02_035657, partial [Chaenocephalus aceratus]